MERTKQAGNRASISIRRLAMHCKNVHSGGRRGKQGLQRVM
jgi:hypothetical protein